MATYFTPPDLPTDTILTLASTIKIAAPAQYVFDILLNTTTWPSWNRFIPSIDTASTGGILAPGMVMHATIRMKDPSTRVQEMTVTTVESHRDKHLVAWKAEGMPSWLLRGLRSSECLDLEGGKCEFRSWEWMAGPAAYAVQFLYGKLLQTRFEEMAQDLKAYAEKTYAEKSSTAAS